MSAESDPAMLSATEARRRLRAGRLHWRTLHEACRARIAADEPRVRAIAHLAPELAEPPADGPLHGLPIAVKDVLDTQDLPSQYGSPIWAGHRPRADAAAVAWARQAGASVLAKSVTTEFATRHPGPTTNPHNPAHTPGGSSSGSAAGVAAGFFPLAFGTQTAGSIVRPAAFCGVVGYKPTYAAIPRLGMKLMSESLDTIGVLARTVADCALFAGAVGRRDLGDPEQAPGRAPSIGLCRSPVWSRAAPETHALWDRVATTLGRAGARLQERELAPDFTALDTAHPIVMHGESALSLGWELAHHPEGISPGLRERLDWGLAQGTPALDDARATFIRLRHLFPATLDGLDILLTPSAPGEAPLGLASTGEAVFNAYWTALGLPCVTVPAGTGPTGLPLGIQIVGRFGDDRAVLAWAAWVEAVLK